MVVARVTVAVLALFFAGLIVARHQAAAANDAMEKTWAARLQTPSSKHLQAVRQNILLLGGQLRREGGLTQVTYNGSHAGCVLLVNKLMSEPLEWTRWSCEKTSADNVRASIYLKNL
jgi:hypothetical protein